MPNLMENPHSEKLPVDKHAAKRLLDQVQAKRAEEAAMTKKIGGLINESLESKPMTKEAFDAIPSDKDVDEAFERIEQGPEKTPGTQSN
jgi:hypothetical protein